jgi:hypothetical protein
LITRPSLHLPLEQDELEELQRPLPVVQHKVAGREADIELLGVQHVVTQARVQVVVSLLRGVDQINIWERKVTLIRDTLLKSPSSKYAWVIRDIFT